MSKKPASKPMNEVVRILRVRSGVKVGAKKALVGRMKKVLAVTAAE